MEVSVWNLTTWLGVALGIPWNAEYPRKVLPEGTSTSWNVLEFTYHIIGDAMWLPSVLLGSPLFTK